MPLTQAYDTLCHTPSHTHTPYHTHPHTHTITSARTHTHTPSGHALDKQGTHTAHALDTY